MGVRGKSARILSCMIFLLGFSARILSAQTTVNPSTSSVQFAGTPNAQSSITAPTGGLVLYGSALSPVTNQPVRHLWVGDATAGLCRMDPDLDSAGPYAVNPNSC